MVIIVLAVILLVSDIANNTGRRSSIMGWMFYRIIFNDICQGSSVAEQTFHKRQVASSILAPGTRITIEDIMNFPARSDSRHFLSIAVNLH